MFILLFINMRLILIITGGTTTDEVAASSARTSTAPTAQDLQATIAPILTTTGTNIQDQPEIPQAEELSPSLQVPFIEDVEMLDLLLSLEDSSLDESSTLHDYQLFAKLSRCFVITELAEFASLGKYRKLKFQQNTTWIGNFLNP